MVNEVWEDGEITLTKGGDLYGQRNLHCIQYGDQLKAWPKELFPKTNELHGYVQVNYKDGEKARDIILGGSPNDNMDAE